VINNNYLIKKMLAVPGVGIAWPNRRKLQEARFHLQKLKADTGIGSVAVNQRLADFGVQTYFESHEPMIVAEPVTPEASDTVSREDLDRFTEAFALISKEAYTNPDIIRTAPHRCTVHQSRHEALEEYAKTIPTWRQYLKKRDIK
jgi:glycine dehydrogenase subunit 2